MGKRDALIALYAEDLKTKCHMDPDMDLLEKVTIGVGPAIYDPDGATVSTQQSELALIRNNFLIRKLSLEDGPELMAAIRSVIDDYGRDNPRKYRAVIYYMLVKHFGREGVYF